jgi:ABC-2 type transport system permease protein
VKVLAISKKELDDLVQEKVYVLAFFIQMIIVVGIVYTALLYTSVSAPESGGIFVTAAGSQVRVGIMGEIDLDLKELNVNYLAPTCNPVVEMERSGLVAVLVAPQNMEAMTGTTSLTLILDNTNILSGYADGVISEAVAEYSSDVKRKRLSGSADPDTFINPLQVKEVSMGSQHDTGSARFFEIMYGILIPFILLLPTFLSANMMTDSIVGEKERKTYELLVSSPVTKTDIILGKTLPILAIALAQAALWIILLELKGIHIFNPLPILGMLLLLDLIFIGFGILISAFSETIKDANIGVTLALIITSLAFFAPVSIRKEIADLSPVFLMTKLASNPAVPMEGVAVTLGIMLILGGGFVVLGARLLDWRENLRL